MDARQFLAEFGHIVSAPSGIQRLREMIFSLAATGDLLTDNNDVDARPLLYSIRERKEAHPDQKKVVPPQRELSPYETSAPEHWARCRLGDLVLTITGGGTPSKSNPTYWGGDIPWASVKDLKDNKYLNQTEDCITREGLINSSTNLIPAGRVIVSTRMGLGKLVINRIATAINQDLKALELPDEVDIDFFYILYRTKAIKGKGTTVAGISQEALLNIPAALPPMEEQRRIVSKIDELMALCDRLEAQQQESDRVRDHSRKAAISVLSGAYIANDLRSAWRRLELTLPIILRQPSDVDDLRDLILDLAATGRLSELHRDDSKAERLVEEAKVVRRRRVAGGEVKRKKAPPTDIKEVEIPTPSHWVSATMEDLFRFIDYRGKTPIKTTSGRVLITAKNVRPGRIEATPLEYISETSYRELMTRGWPKIGDLLITTEAPLGNVARIEEEPQFALAQRVINLQPYARLNTRYFMYFMMSPSFQNRLWVNATGTTAKGIKAAKLKRLKVSVPPYEEQDRIVQRTIALLSFCDQLELQMERERALAGLLASACTAAITGIHIEDKERMKAPKTELVSNLRIGISPTSREQAPLAAILVRHQGELPAKALWGSSGLEIEAFYQQLKAEMSNGWIVQPESAYVKEVETA